MLNLLNHDIVIIGAGGAGRIFPFTTNGAIKTGDGMAMAYRAGEALKDMEFVQYHPTGLPGTGILITEGSRGEGGTVTTNAQVLPVIGSNIRVLDVEVLRYDPDKDQAPYFQSYSVPCQEQWVVLDVINYIKDKLDRTLSYHWSCHMAVCGSCGMMVNGEPTLTCSSFVRELPEKIRIELLENFPVARDHFR